jgi:UDP-glucose 4-epimerase
MHVLVTGGAGFIGSHLADRLLHDGHQVTVVDCFDPYYARELKEHNLAGIRRHARARVLELDLARDPLAPALEGVEAVAHLAARAGVRASWGTHFEAYLDNNVLSTQRLLEAARERRLHAFVYASSASVYGDEATEPVAEDAPTRPFSPYGITKLAGEHLARLYRRHHGVPTCSLRYFSVYGPRERPDKGIQIFLQASRLGRPVDVHGDGTQRRDFTFVGDIVEATVRALHQPPVGEEVNLGRGQVVTLAHILDTVERVTGRRLERRHGPPVAGDVRVTAAIVDKARRLLGYAPQVSVEEGIRRQWEAVRGAT